VTQTPKSNGKHVSGSRAVLDIGTTKVACFIAQIDSAGEIRIGGIGHQLSKGIKSGVITDFAEAETSIIAAVHAAEQMAGENVDEVVVNIAGGGIASRNVSVDMTLQGGEVTDRDILDILEEGRASVADADHDILHAFSIGYTLDNAKGIVDPRQMFGSRLGADLHIITAPASVTRNLTHCLGRCHLNVREFVLSPHASALSSLEEDERQLGVILIDMGGGVTTVSVFGGGRNLYSDSVPIGGLHVTSDIAKGLSTTLTHAERLKTLHGSAIASPSDDQVMIAAPQLGEEEDGDDSNVMPRSILVGIIRPRIEEIFEFIRSRIEMSGVEQMAGRRVVLVGGASQLIGVRELAARILGRQVRLGKPHAYPGLADAMAGPAFATGLGMLEYMIKKPFEEQLYETHHTQGKLGGRLGKLTRWFRENF
jgi:cell division protein FtsA